jgi:hypothetical protein
MKRLLIYTTVAVMCFLAGLLAGGTRQQHSRTGFDVPRAVSVCELEGNPDLYDGKLVRVEANFDGQEEPFIFERSCHSLNANVSAPIYLDGMNRVNVKVVPRVSYQPGQPFAVPEENEATVVGVFEANQLGQNSSNKEQRFRILLESVTLFEGR